MKPEKGLNSMNMSDIALLAQEDIRFYRWLIHPIVFFSFTLVWYGFLRLRTGKLEAGRQAELLVFSALFGYFWGLALAVIALIVLGQVYLPIQLLDYDHIYLASSTFCSLCYMIKEVNDTPSV